METCNTPSQHEIQPIKRIKELSRGEKTALIVNALQSQGLNANQASQLMGINRSTATRALEKGKNGILSPLAKIARKSVKQLAKGELVGDMKEIKGSDVLGACNAILDRADPKINKQEIKSFHANINLTDDDRDRFSSLLGIRNNAQIIDSTAEVIEKPINQVLITQKD